MGPIGRAEQPEQPGKPVSFDVDRGRSKLARQAGSGTGEVAQELAETLGVSRSKGDVETALDTITVRNDQGLSGRLALLSGLANGLARSGKPLAALRKSPPPEWREALHALDAVLGQARDRAEDAAMSTELRVQAVEVLSQEGSGQLDDLIVALLDPNQPQGVQSAAARGLAERGDPARREGTERLGDPNHGHADGAAHWRARPFRPPGRCSDRRRGRRNGAALRAGPGDPRGPACVGSRIRPWSACRADAQGSAGERSRKSVRRFEPALDLSGNPERGAILFEKNCMGCHQRQGRGVRRGSGAWRRGRPTQSHALAPTSSTPAEKWLPMRSATWS